VHNTCSTLLANVTLIMRDRFSASFYWEDIKKYHCPVAYTIGFILDILLKQSPIRMISAIPCRPLFA